MICQFCETALTEKEARKKDFDGELSLCCDECESDLFQYLDDVSEDDFEFVDFPDS